MKKRNIPVILLLPLLSLSCSLSHKMERSISKVGLSQAGKRPAPDTTCYSVPEKITWKDSSGVEHINPEKPDVPLNKNDAFQKVQKRRVQEKR